MPRNKYVNDPVLGFIQLNRMHHMAVDKKISRLGLHRSQHITLMHLSHTDGLPSQRQLSEQLGVSPAAVANMLKRLEAGGYIRRAADRSDTRQNAISLTERGREIVEQSHEIFSEIDDSMLSGIETRKLDIFAEVVSKMRDNLQSILEEEQL